MDGMGFLLSSLGIDPEQLKNAAGQVQQVSTDFLKRLDRIERKLDFLASIFCETGENLNGGELARYLAIGGPDNNGTGTSSQSGGSTGV